MRVQVSASEPAPEIVAAILAQLPEWFGIPESTADYVEDARTMPTLLARDDGGAPVGVLVHARHFPESAEIHLLAVARAWHRRGVGRALVDALRALAQADGARLLSVKSVGPSSPDVPYSRTRAFDAACGFLPLEELPELWDEGNPCLIMVQPLG